MGFKENLRSELDFSGMLVKELAVKSGVKKNTIDKYLCAEGKIPSLEKGVKIAQVLGVSVEYLVTGKDDQNNTIQKLSKSTRLIAQHVEKLDEKNKAFVLDFIKWLLTRESKSE